LTTAGRFDPTNREAVRARIEEVGIIPAIRVSSAEDALFAGEAVSAGGIPILEVTTTVPGATKVIHELMRSNPGLIVGAGTLHDLEAARRCIDAGATFLTTPGLDLEIVEFARKKGVLCFPGVLTPTEVMSAGKAGCDLVKVFPCAQVGGPSYIKALAAPFPEVRFIASGGVNQNTATDFVLAGAVALGIGRDLIQPGAIQRRDRDWISELARRFLGMVQEARQRHGHTKKSEPR
jgi:2-dehydro-3-deoxyphosphogluconate aldolase / (4S)-4-hydroxy-2-oxoglutarate aldolase